MKYLSEKKHNNKLISTPKVQVDSASDECFSIFTFKRLFNDSIARNAEKFYKQLAMKVLGIADWLFMVFYLVIAYSLPKRVYEKLSPTFKPSSRRLIQISVRCYDEASGKNYIVPRCLWKKTPVYFATGYNSLNLITLVKT